MEPEGSLLCSKEPSTGPYFESAKSSPYHPIPFSLISNLTLPYHLHLGLPSGLFPSGFPTDILHAISFVPIRVTLPAHFNPHD
jgi:hypothetical protein